MTKVFCAGTPSMTCTVSVLLTVTGPPVQACWLPKNPSRTLISAASAPPPRWIVTCVVPAAMLTLSTPDDRSHVNAADAGPAQMSEAAIAASTARNGPIIRVEAILARKTFIWAGAA